MLVADKNPMQKWVLILLFNLLVVALAGLFLRLLMVFAVPHTNYKYFLHAHSHFAFFGWGFMALFMAFYESFIPAGAQAGRSYKLLFFLSLVAAYGMLISFPFHGYAAVSISFSSLSILISYWFAWRFFKDTAGPATYRTSIRFARASVFFLLISTLGPTAMGPIMANGGEGKPLYYNAIYFYLHFQYNGWFIFGVIALFFRWMEQRSIAYNIKNARRIYRLMVWSVLPAFFLSVLWTGPGAVIYCIAGTAAFIQLAALLPFWLMLKQCSRQLKREAHPAAGIMGTIAAVFFALKLLLQFISSFPLIVRWTLQVRPLVIGYLHLVLLGIFTLFLLAWLIQKNYLPLNKYFYPGVFSFLAGIFLTELLLFVESTLMIFNHYLPAFNQWMFAATLFLPAGIVFLFWGKLTGENYPVNFSLLRLLNKE